MMEFGKKKQINPCGFIPDYLYLPQKSIIKSEKMNKRLLFGALLSALTLFSMQAQDTLSVSKSRKLQFGIDIHYNAALSGHDKYGSLCDDELSDELAFHLSLLYPFHPHFAVGVGTGVECLGFGGYIIPLYGTFRYHPFVSSKASPLYLYTDLGYARMDVWGDNASNGLLTNWGIGWSKPSKKHNRSFNIQLAYNSKMMPYEDYVAGTYQFHKSNAWYHSLSLGIGWAW